MKKSKYKRSLEMRVPQGVSEEVKAKLFEAMEREKCRLKKRYLDERTALSAKRYFDKQVREISQSGKTSRAYQCPWCGFWHLSRKVQG